MNGTALISKTNSGNIKVYLIKKAPAHHRGFFIILRTGNSPGEGQGRFGSESFNLI